MSIKALFQKILGEEESQVSSGYYEVGGSARGLDDANARKVPVNVLDENDEKKSTNDNAMQSIPETLKDPIVKTVAMPEVEQRQAPNNQPGSVVKIAVENENSTPSPFLSETRTPQEYDIVTPEEKKEELTDESSEVEKVTLAQESGEVVATGASSKTEGNGAHFALEKKFKNAIDLIEEMKKDDFFAKYSKEINPIYEGDYRKMLSEMLDHIADHAVDKFPPEIMKRFRDAERLVHDLNKEDHDSKLVVSDGKTYLVKKNIEKDGEKRFELQLEERTYILSHLPVIESFIEEEIKGMELEKSYLADLLGDFKKLKTTSLLAIGIKDHFKCSDEDAARIAKDIMQRSEKKTRKK